MADKPKKETKVETPEKGVEYPMSWREKLNKSQEVK